MKSIEMKSTNHTFHKQNGMTQIRLMLDKVSEGVAIATTDNGAAVSFVIENIPFKFNILYPNGREDKMRYTPTGQTRTQNQVEVEVDKEKRRLWRAMGLYIKAALEAHDNGLIDLKRSMMGNIMLKDGSTMYQKLENNFSEIQVNPKLLLGMG